MVALRSILSIVIVATVALVVGCNRRDNAPAPSTATPTTTNDSAPTPEGMSASAAAAASTPLPVSPSGSTNASTAAQGNDLSNSTRATGNSNVYEPPSGNNPAPAASGAASSTGQSTSSQTLGTSVPPNDGTLPRGTTGSTGSRSGGGKS